MDVRLPADSVRPPGRTTRPHRVLLVAVMAVGVWLRCAHLGAVGFAEDEIDILRAVSSYGVGNYAANAEHPMVAKLMAYASWHAAAKWNMAAAARHLPRVSEEAALRLPAALLGGVITPLALYLLCGEWFPNARVALWAAAFWSLDGQAIALNRSAKEDTIFCAFFFLACALYACAQRLGERRLRDAHSSYVASGAAFGLMLASKYMPQYFGLHALYVRITRPDPGLNRPPRLRYYTAMIGAFLCCNFGVLMPASWRHLAQYFRGHTLIHSGYDVAGRIYVNTLAATPAGVPPWFYVVWLATRTPLVVLAAAALGVGYVLRHPAARASVFLRLFLVLILLPYSFIAVKFVRYILPQLALIDILAAIGTVVAIDALARRLPAGARGVIPVGAVVLFIGVPFSSALATRPYFSLSANALGQLWAPPGVLCPDDEFNDAAIREAVMTVAAKAGVGAAIASDASTVVSTYLARAGRSDIESRSLSRDGLPTPLCETWIIDGEGHRYFENEEMLRAVAMRPPVRVWRIRGAVAVRLYAPDSTIPCRVQ
ncbi:MAG TPA: phospholipid carrier-dependent glycosyltransferase [Vicinamibacterales bacterium]|nr:phospholipid carrier-dependent glycosyltransferase [Vicinamibacterales bacterium]